MRAFSRFFSNRICVILGTASLAVLLIVSITGGFVIHAGPLFLSIHRWTHLAAASVIFWGAAALGERSQLSANAALVSTSVERYATAIGVLLAVVACGVGIRFGTYAASGSDAAGYVSQGELIARGTLTRDEPLARAVGWPDAALSFTTLGYRTGAAPGTIVPTYPPGLPALIAPAQIAFGELGSYLVVPALGASLVLATYLLGVALHSRTAGVIAAALLTTSPIFLFQVSQPMSDIPAATWWTLSLLLALRAGARSAVGAGAAAGLALLTRPNLVPLLIPIAATIAWRHSAPPTAAPWRRRLVALCLFAAGVAPFVIALVAIQSLLYGAFVASGHGSFSEFFSLSSIVPNMKAYAERLWIGEGPALSLVLLSGLVLLGRARHLPFVASDSLRHTLGVAAAVSAAVLLCYLPYGVFPEWFYLRFLLPMLPALFVSAGALWVAAAATLPAATRGIALVLVLAAACSFNVVHAKTQNAFRVRHSEERSQVAGRYLDSVAPRGAVILAGQQSASAYHYTHRPVVRWDLLHVDIDEAIARLQQMGLHPLLVLEDWEKADIKARFPASRTARLDWPPRADIGDFVHVLVYDPADREAHNRFASDRLHQSAR